jgi:hypothetical protein
MLGVDADNVLELHSTLGQGWFVALRRIRLPDAGASKLYRQHRNPCGTLEQFLEDPGRIGRELPYTSHRLLIEM